MKKFLLIFLVLFSTVVFAQDLPNIPDQPIETLQYAFRGKWLPSVDPIQIGPENYQTLTNLRYGPSGDLESVNGYSKINSTVLSGAPEVDAGIHFRKDNPAESHVIVNADGTIYQNTTAIPNAGDFSGTSLHTDASGAGNPRFSIAPYGHVAYSNGVEAQIWAGSEMPAAAFITSTAAVTNSITNPKDYSIAVNNDLTDNLNVAVIGGGNDSNTILLIHADGTDDSTADYTSDDSNAHTVGTQNDAKLEKDQKKYGVTSFYLDGTGDYLNISDSDGVDDFWYRGTDAFTIGVWIRPTDVSGDFGIFQQFDDADNLVQCLWTQSTGQLYFGIEDNAVNTVAMQDSWSPSANTWYHISVIRGWGGNANDWAITVNGAVIATTTDADEWPDLAGDLHIGTTSAGAFTGYVDEFRFSDVARWTSAFTPPVRPYSSAARTWLVGASRPLQGLKFYIGDANTQASTMTAKEWNGASWTSLTITDNTDTGASLAQTGTVTWSSTVSTSKVKFLENRLFYWYQFAIDAGDATIYRCTLDAPWQDIVDLWDGIFRQPIQFQAYKSSKFEDYTIEVNEPTPTYYGDLGGMTSAEHLILMFDDRQTAIKWTMVAGSENTTAATVTIYFWNGDEWSSVGTVSDTTLDDAGSTKSLGQSGVMSWEPPDNGTEFPQTLFGTTGYAYKLVWSGTLTASASYVNTVTGIPAQLEIKPFKFPVQYRDRLLLCGFSESGDGNRCDYSLTHAPQVFNGNESSNGGIQSLYFGGEGEELTAGIQLYNRLGSNIFIFFVALKENETYVLTGDGPTGDNPFRIFPVSLNVGCPAPYTLVSAEVGFNIATDVQRHIAIWVSYNGPVIFDGAVIYKIPGLETYFDPNSSNYLGQTTITSAIGWYDQSYGEYNIIVGSNWFTYNLRQKKWFAKSTGAATLPMSAWPVRDTSGNEYVYAGLSTGYVMRLENGTDWDGTGITQTIRTGDFFPTKSIWDNSRLRRIKVIAKVVSSSTSLAVTNFVDGKADESSVMSVDLTSGGGSSDRIVKDTSSPTAEGSIFGWAHSLKFSLTTTSATKGFQPLLWGAEYLRGRRDD